MHQKSENAIAFDYINVIEASTFFNAFEFHAVTCSKVNIIIEYQDSVQQCCLYIRIKLVNSKTNVLKAIC